LRNKAAAVATWIGSPPCDAHVSAISSPDSSYSSTPPYSRSGKAWNGFAAERRQIRNDGSPASATTRPRASTTTIEPV
jgi:hypothetical protein